MTKLSFNVLDDLNQSLKVLSDFIAQKNTKEVIEKAISIMADSIKKGARSCLLATVAVCVMRCILLRN